jgi:hypothetical protein
MSPPERDTGANSKENNSASNDDLNVDLSNTPLESNQSVNSSASDDTDNEDPNGTVHTQNGQLGYQQLVDNDVNDGFDDFQLLAESRLSSNKKNVIFH